MIIKKPDKQSLLYMVIVVVLAVLVCVGVVYYISQTKIEEVIFEKPETLIERQLRKLDELRGDAEALSEEEIQEQLDELDKLHQESK